MITKQFLTKLRAYIFEFLGYNTKSNFGNIRAWSKQGIDYVNFENLNSQFSIISKGEIIKKGFTNEQYENALSICLIANNIIHRKFIPTVVKCTKFYNKAYIMNTYLQYNRNTSSNGSIYNSLEFTELEIDSDLGDNSIKPSSFVELIKPYLKNKIYKMEIHKIHNFVTFWELYFFCTLPGGLESF